MHPLPQAAYTKSKKQFKQTCEKTCTKTKKKRGSIRGKTDPDVQSTVQSGGYKMVGFLKSIFSFLCISCHFYICTFL